MLDCEIEALTTLNHSNILRCFDVVREPSHCFIITEFCNQGDLSELVKKKKKNDRVLNIEDPQRYRQWIYINGG